MNSKSLLPAIFAACLLLGYGPVASAQTPERAEPDSSAEKEQETREIAGSWTSGAPSPETETSAEEDAKEKVVENLDTVAPGATTPSSGQDQSKDAPRDAADNCLVSTIEAVLADRMGRDSGLSIDAQDGVASLSGTLPDQASIEDVRDAVANIKGVNRVDISGLKTGPTTSRASTDPK